MPRWAARSLAVVCYLVALAGAAAFGLFVLGCGLGLWPDTRLFVSDFPWLIDLAWLVAFAVQHSLMARESFKRLWTRLVPPWLERSLYAALSGILVGLVPLVWQPLPGEPLWRLPSWFVVVPLWGAAMLALTNLRHDHAGLFGLRQVWSPGRPEEKETLVVTGAYRFVRHPLMSRLLCFLLAQPIMRPEVALLSGGLSAYILLGIQLEERDLLRRFGAEYERYRRHVPMLIPWRGPNDLERA
jgi:protein-S-isoprenylcysteine O-methyltransferase Ste14